MEIRGKVDDKLVLLKMKALVDGELKDLDVQLKEEMPVEGEGDG